MSAIKIMDTNLANKIAAGEVIEKCASVVKELVENSIDAGSDEIKVELLESGIKMIRITDNGKGMDEKDAILCFTRHATSKIRTEDDLSFINTLGFRGEALASIASVSNIVLNTCTEEIGTKVVIDGGKSLRNSVGDSRKGTTIEVNNLFYNTPARLKFLKSLKNELYTIVSLIEKLALSNPNISFDLINDGTSLLKTSGSGDILKTIHEIYGLNVSRNMVYINEENYDYKVSGYVSNINVYKSTKNSMIIFVNNRIIKNAFINRVIKDAYHTFLADNKYPIVVINIEVDPSLIDVNIHPTKQDIKLSKMPELEDLLFNVIRDSLNEKDNAFVVKSKQQTDIEEEVELENEMIENYTENISFDFGVQEEHLVYENTKEMFYPVGLVMGTYLICQNDENMYMVDIHAGNERINYEMLLNRLKKRTTNIQSMLVPVTIEYTKEETMKLTEYLNLIREFGFEIEEFGINTFKISSHPDWLIEGYEEESIKKVLEVFINLDGKFDRVKFNENIAINLSCKMSVKANTSLTHYEQENLIKKLLECEFSYTCPHGRPTILKYPKYELEKLFKRVNS